MRIRGLTALLLLPAVLLLPAAPAAQAPQGQTVFRAGTALVPVDVRVLDRRGQAVTDLTADDFVILENGVRQQIRHFSAHVLTPAAPDTGGPLRRVAGPDTALSPQNRRLFLIVLGRGRLQEPSKALDAALRFVRDRLLPQDQVALMAWNRATDFTVEHEQVAAVIRRFRDSHAEIEMDLGLHFGGLAGLYAGRQLPASIQAKIDRVFSGEFVPGSREILPAAAGSDAEALLRKSELEVEAESLRRFAFTDGRLADLMTRDVATMGMSFDDYVALNRQTLQDVGNLYAGIEYLRFIEGEKHLIFLNEQGILLPRADYDRDIAALASAARVAIDSLQTGGVATRMVNGFPEIPPHIGFALGALRTLSETSGGQLAVSTSGEDAFDRILEATGSGYLLGYTPSTPALDGRFRRISIEVRRRNVTASYRRGYFARAEEDFDPRRVIATTRMVAAANVAADVKDLKLSVEATSVGSGGSRVVRVDAVVDASRLAFAAAGEKHLAALNVAVLTTDQNGTSLGELWQPLDMTVTTDLLAHVKQKGLPFTVQVPVRTRPTFVKVIVYDYGADLIGSTRVRVR